MPLIAGGAMAAGSLAGGIIGSAAQSKAAEQAMAMARQAAEQFNGIIPPEVKALIVEELKSQGLYTPEIDQVIDAGESAYAKAKENPELIRAQQGALEQMVGVSKTGLQASDRAALNKVRNEGQRDIEGKRQQILQEMQARGLGGSGAELAMQIAGSQSGAEQASEQADRLAAQAQQNALKAIGDSSTMASQARGDDYRLMSAKAQAADEMNRFNVSNQRDVAQRNVQGRNIAQAHNLEQQQRLYEQNVQNRRDEAVRMETAKQAAFDNKMKKAAAVANALNGQASMIQTNGKNSAASAQGTWSGAGQLAGALAKGFGSSSPGMATTPGSANSTAASSSMYTASHGGVVPGSAKVHGDSPVNDTVPVALSPGEVVIPRSVASEPSKIPSFLKKTKSIPEQNKPAKAEKEHKGPSDAELAHHIVQSNALLHSLMSKLNKKGQ